MEIYQQGTHRRLWDNGKVLRLPRWGCKSLKTEDAEDEDGCRKRKDNEGHEGLCSTCCLFSISYIVHNYALCIHTPRGYVGTGH